MGFCCFLSVDPSVACTELGQISNGWVQIWRSKLHFKSLSPKPHQTWACCQENITAGLIKGLVRSSRWVSQQNNHRPADAQYETFNGPKIIMNYECIPGYISFSLWNSPIKICSSPSPRPGCLIFIILFQQRYLAIVNRCTECLEFVLKCLFRLHLWVEMLDLHTIHVTKLLMSLTIAHIFWTTSKCSLFIFML